MNLQTLSIFLEVMQQLSFTEVAHARNVAPSSISRTISNLEVELGIKLFQRSTRKLTATEAGRTYFERVSSALGELKEAEQVAKDISNEPRGTLRVTVPTVFGSMYIVPMLPSFLEAFPELKIELIMSDAYSDLIEERIDIAIRLGTLQDSSYISRKIKGMTFYICANPDYLKQSNHPETPDDLQQHNCLLFPRSGYSTTKWLFRDSDKKLTEVSINGNCIITNSESIKQSTLSGMGISLLPDWLVQKEIENGELVNLYEDYKVTATDFNSAVWLLYPSRDYLPLKTKTFSEYLMDKIHY